MPGHDPATREQTTTSGGDKEPSRTLIIIVATLAWAATTFLPVIFPRIPSVPEIGPAFLTFLGAYIAVPEISRKLRDRDKRKGDDD
jgi:hypothetical protein